MALGSAGQSFERQCQAALCGSLDSSTNTLGSAVSLMASWRSPQTASTSLTVFVLRALTESLCSHSLAGAVKRTQRIGMPKLCARLTQYFRVSTSALVLSVRSVRNGVPIYCDEFTHPLRRNRLSSDDVLRLLDIGRAVEYQSK